MYVGRGGIFLYHVLSFRDSNCNPAICSAFQIEVQVGGVIFVGLDTSKVGAIRDITAIWASKGEPVVLRISGLGRERKDIEYLPCLK